MSTTSHRSAADHDETSPDTGVIAAPPCSELSAGEARYLMAILELERDETTTPTQAGLARELGVSPPTALEMVRRLRQLGLVQPGTVHLTGAGISAALVLRSRYSAAQELAHDVLGLDDEEASREALTLASSLSPALARRLIAWRAARH
jgi:Mn-dependent DtxR family transcriptional regulator